MDIDPLIWAEWLFLLAPWLAVPIGLTVALRGPDAARAEATGRRPVTLLVLVAAPCLVLAVALDLAPAYRLGLLAPYAAFVAYAGLVALRRVATRRPLDAPELAIDAGLASLAVGLVWLVVYLGGYELRGFSGLWALLTANHFHFAGFGGLILAGATGRHLARHQPDSRVRAVYRVVPPGLLVALPVLALGIDLDRTLEIVGITLYAILVPILAATLVWLAATSRAARPLARALLATAGLAALTAITLAALWGLFRPPIVDLPTMVATHAPLNALGFITLGLLGLHLLDSPPP